MFRGYPNHWCFGHGGRVPGDTENTAAILERDTHITRDLGTGVPKTRGYPNHCDTAGLRIEGERVK